MTLRCGVLHKSDGWRYQAYQTSKAIRQIVCIVVSVMPMIRRLNSAIHWMVQPLLCHVSLQLSSRTTRPQRVFVYQRYSFLTVVSRCSTTRWTKEYSPSLKKEGHHYREQLIKQQKLLTLINLLYDSLTIEEHPKYKEHIGSVLFISITTPWTRLSVNNSFQRRFSA